MLLALLLALPVQAAEIAGVQFAQTWTLDGQSLGLNGAGLREYGFLKVDVYAAALYLPVVQRSEATVLESAGGKVLHMHFFRDVGREDTVKVWDHYFAENCPAPCVLPQASIAAFKALVPETRAGDTQTYLFRAEGVEFLANGRTLGKVFGADFARLLLSTYIGRYPPTPELRAALLGSR